MTLLLEEEPQIERLPDSYEVVNGEIVELPPMSAVSSEVANLINDELGAYARATNYGRNRVEMLFRIPLPDDDSRNRKPDVAFIKYDRWPKNKPMVYRENPVDLVPDLAVEVASPSDEVEDLFSRAQEYLQGGVRLVWLVMPKLRVIYAFSPESPSRPRIFTVTDTLSAGDVLPGFEVPMAPLFPTILD